MKKYLNILLIVICALFSLSTVAVVNNNDVKAFENVQISENGALTGIQRKDTDKGFNDIFTKYRTVIAGVSGLVAISMLLFFIVQAFRLGSSAHNASERQKAIQGLIWIGIATAISGSVSLFAGLFYGMFK